jgi:hypothetical protein
MFITVFTRALNWTLPWAILFQYIPPQPISLKSILILFSYLRVGFPSGVFPSGFLTKILPAFLFAPMSATCPVHLIFFDLIILIIYKAKGTIYGSPHYVSSLCIFLQLPIISSLLDPNILLDTLFWNSFSTKYLNYKNSKALVHKRTILTEPPPLVGEVSANFCGYKVSQRIPTAVNLGFLVPEPLLFRSSSSSIILTRLSELRARPTTSQKIG